MRKGQGRALAAALMVLSVSTRLAAQSSGVARMGAIFSGQAVKVVGTSSVRWLPGTLGYLQDESDSVTARFSRVDPLTGARTPLLAPAAESKLLAEYGRASGKTVSSLPFRHFDLARNGGALWFDADGARYLFAIDSGALHKLPFPAKVGPLDDATTEPGTFSPDFRRYAFIRDFDNLWLFDPATGREEQLVKGTSDDNLIGFLDAGPWYVWSPDGKWIAYFKANQQGLHRYPLLRDLEQKAKVDYFRYPFTNDPNPVLELHVINVETKHDVLLKTSTVEEPFLRDIGWFPDSREVTFQVVNQWENHLELFAADPATGRARSVLVDADSAYLDPLHNFRVLADGNRFLWSSESTGWRQIYLYDRQGRLLKQLTSGEFATKAVVGVDEKKGVVYFVAATKLGLEQHLFRVGLDGTGLTQITREPGWHEVFVDSALRTFLDRASSLSRPWTATLRTIDGKIIRELAHSDTTGLHALGIAPPELLTLKAADGVTDIHGLLFKPADFNPSKRYPVIVWIYGGPHTKAIRDRYETNDLRAAIAQLGFLVFEVDARGTLDRGKKFQAGNYLRMGQVDVDDQAAAVRQLRSRPYVDSTRVGVTGISHGGYLTTMMVLRYPDVFQVGVAGAPITDLRNGPRQYIGRIMRTPQANPDGYAKGDAVALAPTLKGRLLVMYGTNDHNAVNANAMQLIRKLEDAGRPVDVAVYPNGDHVLGGAAAIHGIKTTVGYFLEHLRPDDWEATWHAIWQ